MKSSQVSVLVSSMVVIFSVGDARAASGTWLGNSGNWSDPGIWSGGTIADGTNATANFTGVNITADKEVTNDAPRTIGNITFTDASTASHDLTIKGSSALTLDTGGGTPTINVTQSGRMLAIACPLGGVNGLSKSGAGILVLSGANTYTGVTTVSAGMLVVDGGTVSGAADVKLLANTSMSIMNGGTLNSTGTVADDNVSDVSWSIIGGSATSTWNLGGQDFHLYGYSPEKANKNMTIDGAGVSNSAVFTNIKHLLWGRSTKNCDLLVTDGGLVSVNSDVRIGSAYYSTDATNNTVTIQGGTANSTMNVGQDFYIGYGSRPGTASNTATVGAGGYLNITRHTYVGDMASGANTATHSSANKLVVNGGSAGMDQLFVGRSKISGRSAKANMLEVTNGGQLSTSGHSYVGRAEVSGTESSDNTAVIEGTLNGTNALWDLGGSSLTVGYAAAGGVASGNVCRVNDGGVVTNISTLTVNTDNTLLLGAGGRIYASSAVTPGTIAVDLDSGVTPPGGLLTVSGNLNISNGTVEMDPGGDRGKTCVIASYGSLTGTFAVTNTLLYYDVDTNYQGLNQIALVYAPSGTLLIIK